jgi:hypothetical protein
MAATVMNGAATKHAGTAIAKSKIRFRFEFSHEDGMSADVDATSAIMMIPLLPDYQVIHLMMNERGR